MMLSWGNLSRQCLSKLLLLRVTGSEQKHSSGKSAEQLGSELYASTFGAE
jgi:hypothetical protein